MAGSFAPTSGLQRAAPWLLRRHRRLHRRQLWRILRARGAEPHILLIYAIKIAMHYHYAAITRALSEADRAGGVVPDAMRSFSRAERRKPAEAVAS